MLVLALMAAIASTSCPIGDAVYRLKGAPGVTAHFFAKVRATDPARRLGIAVADERSGVAYTATVLREGAGAGPEVHLYDLQRSRDGQMLGGWVLGEERDLFILPQRDRFDDDFTPQTVRVAPARLFMPGLESLFWYGDYDHRVSVPLAFFELSSCTTSH